MLVIKPVEACDFGFIAVSKEKIIKGTDFSWKIKSFSLLPAKFSGQSLLDFEILAAEFMISHKNLTICSYCLAGTYVSVY